MILVYVRTVCDNNHVTIRKSGSTTTTVRYENSLDFIRREWFLIACWWTHTQTHIDTHTPLDKSNFNKPGTCQPLAGARLV